MKFQITIKKGAFGVTDYWRAKLNDYVHKNGEARAIVEILTLESRKLRGYFHGSLIPVWAYCNELDYRDHKVLEQLFEVAKQEFSPEILIVDKVPRKVSASSKGRALKKLTESLYDYLVENYAVDERAINPNEYKKFADEIYGTSDYEDFIAYAIDMKWLSTHL
jgi:hypothetical protein